MNEAILTIVYIAGSASEAGEINTRLKDAGLHPAELGVTTPLVTGGPPPVFPVEVPAEEAARARMLLAE